MVINRKIIRNARHTIANFLYYTGILHLLASLKLKNKAVVLMYHRILTDKEAQISSSQNGIIVTQKTFAKHLKCIKYFFSPITLATLIKSFKKSEPFHSKSCLITFDDGWKDNYINAFPLLKRYGLPAVIFLPTDFIDTHKRFWQEQLTYLLLSLLKQYHSRKAFYAAIQPIFEKFGLSNIPKIKNKATKEWIGGIISNLKRQDVHDSIALIKRLKILSHNHFDPSFYSDFLKWSEVKLMAKDRIEFGSHGKSHAILTHAGISIDNELNESKTIIEKNLNRMIMAFSYPNGNFDKKVINAIRKSAYGIAFGTKSGIISINDNPYTLNRINIHEDMTNSVPMFICRILGVF